MEVPEAMPQQHVGSMEVIDRKGDHHLGLANTFDSYATATATSTPPHPYGYSSYDANDYSQAVMTGDDNVQLRNRKLHRAQPQRRAMMRAMTPSTTTTYCHIPRHKIKKVPVTSCDSCRLRKLKCNAKELPAGTPCMQCAKHSSPCTFEDRDEIQLSVTKPRAASIRGVASNRKRTSSSSSSLAQTYSYEGQGAPINHLLHNNSDAFTSEQHITIAWEQWILHNTQYAGTTHHIVNFSTVLRNFVEDFLRTSSFSLVILPPALLVTCNVQFGRLGAIPNYLLQTIVACAVTSSIRDKPELELWRVQLWQRATQSVHAILISQQEPTIELLQALLLLSCNWPGPLARIERQNTFSSAIKIASSLGLNRRANGAATNAGQAQREGLFWALYCYDKVLSIGTGQPPSVPYEETDLDAPAFETVMLLMPMSSNECAWLHRLIIASIQLCRLMEEIYLAHAATARFDSIASVGQFLACVRPVEEQLEAFCKSHKWLLGINMSAFVPVCKALLEAIVSQLHLCQLQLFLPALHFESGLHGSLRDGPTTFCSDNTKSLAACVESAWHLVQQASAASLSRSTATDYTRHSVEETENMTFAKACAATGFDAFNFLAQNWSDWDDGRGCAMFAPSGQTHDLLSGAADFPPGGNHHAQHHLDKTLGGEEATASAQTWATNGQISHMPANLRSSASTPDMAQTNSLQSEHMDRPLPARRTTAPQPLNLSNVNELRASRYEDAHHPSEPSNELIVPAYVKDPTRSAPPSRCDTATMANLLLSTPARLLFHGIEESVEATSSSQHADPQAAEHYNKADCKALAMLTPIDATFIEAARRAQDEAVKADEAQQDEDAAATSRCLATVEDKVQQAPAGTELGRPGAPAADNEAGSALLGISASQYLPLESSEYTAQTGNEGTIASRTPKSASFLETAQHRNELDAELAQVMQQAKDDGTPSYLTNAVEVLRSSIKSL